ncbi:MAG: inorganic phosphate transporter [Thermodesulfobacteriota bacterium]
MQADLYILIISVVAGAYMAWNIGANDVANSMASAVGSKAITMRQALVLATILTFAGATLVGSHVSETIRKGIVYSDTIGNHRVVVLGLLSALISASLWVCLSTYKSLPVSTTHSIVGAMIGFGLVAGGPSAVNWRQVSVIVTSWVLSPLLSALCGFLMFRAIDKMILSRMDTVTGAERTTPVLVALTIYIMTLSLFLDTPLGKKLGLATFHACLMSLGVAVTVYLALRVILRALFRRHRPAVAEEIFRYLQVMTSCYVAFGNGANDVANAMGPLAGVYYVATTGSLAEKAPVPVWMLAFGGMMICVGISTWGYRVIETMGSKITELTCIRGFTVEFSAATMILVASMMGLPVSTTHAAVGAYVGVGLARGLQGLLDLGVLWRILLYWVITVPVAAVTCAVIFFVLAAIFQ